MPDPMKTLDPVDLPGGAGDGLPIAVNRRRAASLLGISERLLWTWTATKRIPHVRIGARVLYPLHLLREWLEKQAKSTAE